MGMAGETLLAVDHCLQCSLDLSSMLEVHWEHVAIDGWHPVTVRGLSQILDLGQASRVHTPTILTIESHSVDETSGQTVQRSNITESVLNQTCTIILS